MGPITEPRYTARVSVTGGRGGHATSDDGMLDVQLRRPKANGDSGGTNPEQLFAAAWGGCYQQALIGAAKNAGEDASQSTVLVEILQGTDADGNSGLGARITVDIPGMETAKVQEFANAANETCPYSRATRGNINVEIVANGS
ncbi:MAG TPA: Ohr family peroxiredoxin [Thermomicrobiales bacterium]|nr:Ohr family peroxiredoxin [Thermomicrobiales bacterium]